MTRLRLSTLLLVVAPVLAHGQAAIPPELINGGFEQSTGERPDGWSGPGNSDPRGYAVRVVSETPHSGGRCAVLDSTAVDTRGNPFAAIKQTIDASRYRGQRVRFHAAVRVTDATADGRAQLWLRVDRRTISGGVDVLAFDNMQDRPIRDGTWSPYEIVAEVASDADAIHVGMLVLGNAKAWIDDASLERVGDEVGVTAAALSVAASATADDAPQPFFVAWLWLAAFALALFAIAHAPASLAQRFAQRFSVSYWLLYYLPMPFDRLLAPTGIDVVSEYRRAMDQAVRWTAAQVLGIHGELVAPNGSGDTTFAYVQLLVCFAGSLAVAIAWSAVHWRKTQSVWVNDLLRTYLRYALAITMVGYGLAKLGSTMNQFPPPDANGLMKTYGQSSPMNLVWTFMGASRPYTMFAGLGEVVAALLLIWRRTTSLGALVAVGVTTNVVMLNFCYDVPVKQYSAHLLITAVLLLLADARRLSNILVWNRPIERVDLRPPYCGPTTIWIQRALKALLIGVAIVQPVWAWARMEWQARVPDPGPAYFGTYLVDRFVRDGAPVPPNVDDQTRWRSLSLVRLPWGRGDGRGPSDYLMVVLMDGTRLGGSVAIGSSGRSLAVESGSPLVPPTLEIAATGEDRISVTGTIGGKAVAIDARRQRREDFLLVNRGFRWINEYPYNR